MKKILFILLFISIGISSYSQVVNIGTGQNTGDGDPLRTAMQKINTQFAKDIDSIAVHRSAINSIIPLMLRWDGGATGLNAATGRASLGGTTIGQSVFTLPNIGVVSFLRINNNNTVTARSVTDFKLDLNLQNVSNESKATMFTSPTFTGTLPKYSTTDTLATRAYARLQGGGSGGGLTQPQVSGIVHDTIVARIGAGVDISTLLNAKENSLGNPSTNGYVLSSTTGGVRSWVEQGGTGGGLTSGQVAIQINDSIEALKTSAIQGVAVADSNQYKVGGYATPSLVDSKIALAGGGADSSIYVTVTRLRNEIDYLAAIIESYTGIDPGEAKYDRYVSNSGNDANDGLTPSTAWQTISKVNEAVFGPGATIHFRRGDEWREQLTINYSGSSTDPITYTAYGTGPKPIINAANIVSSWTDGGTNIWRTAFINTEPLRTMVVIDDIVYMQVATKAELTTASTYWINTASTPDSIYVYRTADPGQVKAEVSAREYAIRGAGSRYINLSYLEAKNAANKGIVFYSGGIKIETHNIIDSVVVNNNRFAGISIADGSSNVTIKNSEANLNGNGIMAWGNQGPEKGSNAIGSDDILITHCTTKNTFHDWTITGNYVDGTGFQLFNSTNSFIEHCVSENDAGGIYLDAWGNHCIMTMRYNKIINAGVSYDGNPGIGTTSIGIGGYYYIYYNLVVNSGGTYGAYLNLHDNTLCGYTYLYNNTFYSDYSDTRFKSTLLEIAYPNDHHVLKNNIFAYAAGSDAGRTNIKLGGTLYPESDYNLFFRGTNIRIVDDKGTSRTNIADWRTASGQDANGIQGDPLFTTNLTDFTLQSTSPAISAGVKIPSIPQVDILGNPVGSAPSMGAYEYGDVLVTGITVTGAGSATEMPAYISATQEYIDYCTTKSYPTKVIFTTGPVDDQNASGSTGWNKYLAYEAIRSAVDNDPTRILFDFADILCYDNNSQTPTTTTYGANTYPIITPTNVGSGNYAHMSQEGCLKLGKAMWWMLARIAGWDGN